MVMSRLTAESWPFITGDDDTLQQAIGLLWNGDTPPATLLIDGALQSLVWHADSQGLRYAIALVPLQSAPREVQIGLPSTDQAHTIKCTVEPPSHWELFVVPHSHV